MLWRSSDYHQTLSLLTLLRFYFKPTVSFMFQVVICDTCVLLALKGLPLRESRSTAAWRTGLPLIPFIPAPVKYCADVTAMPQFTHRDPSSEADKVGQKTFDTSSG